MMEYKSDVFILCFYTVFLAVYFLKSW